MYQKVALTDIEGATGEISHTFSNISADYSSFTLRWYFQPRKIWNWKSLGSYPLASENIRREVPVWNDQPINGVGWTVADPSSRSCGHSARDIRVFLERPAIFWSEKRRFLGIPIFFGESGGRFSRLPPTAVRMNHEQLPLSCYIVDDVTRPNMHIRNIASSFSATLHCSGQICKNFERNIDFLCKLIVLNRVT
jgi:hypothetical protein